MREFDYLSIDLSKNADKIINRLRIVQSNAADKIVDYMKVNANKDTGAFVDSIYRTDTTYDGNIIETKITSDLKVKSLLGKSYNLGYLLEIGTSPHEIRPIIANALRFEVNGEEVFAKKVNHPGTVAYNNYRNAMNAIRPEYQKDISEAVKEAFE